MTVSSTATQAGPYAGNGATVAFPFAFKALTTGEVSVLADGETVSSGLYSVSLTDSGGTVTFTSAPASGVEILILSDPDFTQDIDFQNNGPFNAETHTEGLDRAALRALALKAKIDALFPDSARIASARASKALAFDSDGDPILIDPIATDADVLGAGLESADGASLVGTADGETVQDALEARPTAATLADATGADAIGTADGSTLQEKLDSLESANILAGFRTAPHADFSWLGIYPRVDGAGVVQPSRSVVAYALAIHAGLISDGILYVADVDGGGNNANSGLNPGAALATIDYACETAGTPSRIYLLGSNDPANPKVFRKFDFRQDDPRGAILKIIVPLGHCIIEEAGDAASDLTWSTVGVTYEATPTIVSSAVPRCVEYKKILRSDGSPLRLPKLASGAAVDAAGLGWAWDGTKIYIRYGSLDIEANKADFRITYAREDGLSRCFFWATKIVFDVGPGCSLTFNGVAPLALSNGSTRAMVYAKGVTFQNCPDHGFDAQGAEYYLQDCVARFNKSDNFHPADGPGFVSTRAVEINCTSYEAGDFDTYGVTVGGTNNGSSMHGAGHVARFGGRYTLNGGPDIVDTGTGKSWNVGVIAGASRATSNGYGFFATSSTVSMWLDTCYAYDEPTAEIATGVGCTMYLYNTTGRVSSHVGTVASYTPVNS